MADPWQDAERLRMLGRMNSPIIKDLALPPRIRAAESHKPIAMIHSRVERHLCGEGRLAFEDILMEQESLDAERRRKQQQCKEAHAATARRAARHQRELKLSSTPHDEKVVQFRARAQAAREYASRVETQNTHRLRTAPSPSKEQQPRSASGQKQQAAPAASTPLAAGYDAQPAQDQCLPAAPAAAPGPSTGLPASAASTAGGSPAAIVHAPDGLPEGLAAASSSSVQGFAAAVAANQADMTPKEAPVASASQEELQPPERSQLPAGEQEAAAMQDLAAAPAQQQEHEQYSDQPAAADDQGAAEAKAAAPWDEAAARACLLGYAAIPLQLPAAAQQAGTASHAAAATAGGPLSERLQSMALGGSQVQPGGGRLQPLSKPRPLIKPSGLLDKTALAKAIAQIEERRVSLPPLCNCGHPTPITGASYVLRCCNNCSLYRDGARWEQLLLGVLQGAGLL